MYDSLKFDSVGNRLFPGKTVRTLDWSVTTDTTLPSWLTFTNGDSANLALTVQPMSTYGTDGRVNLQWSGTPSTTLASSIKLGFAFDIRQFHEVGFVFKDLVVGNSLGNLNQLDLAIGCHTYPQCGAYFKQNATSQKLEARIYNQANSDDYTDLPYAVLGNGFNAGRKQYGMCMSVPEKRVYLLGGEDTPVLMIQPNHPNGANSSWPNPTAAGQMPVMGMELINKAGAADANAWIRFSGFKAWFVTG